MAKKPSFDDLPEEATVNIFLRLPVKALIRSTLVNRYWYSLITNPFFISTQIKCSISHCTDNAVLKVPPFISQRKHCSLVEAETGSLIEEFKIPFKTRSSSLKFVGSVNGLMLLTDLHSECSFQDLYLWNPYVKRHTTLVSTCFKKHLVKRFKWFYTAALGFNKESNDFRVVRIFYVKEMDRMGKPFRYVAPKVEVFSLKDRTWRKLKDTRVSRVASEYGTFVNGSYYWLDVKLESEEERVEETWILSFDFDKEVFREIRLPEEVFNCLGVSARFRLMQFEGSLAVCVQRRDKYTKRVTSGPHCIWLMSLENGVMSWTLRFRAVLETSGWPMNITKSGTLISETYSSQICMYTRILSYNLKTMHYEDLGCCKRAIFDADHEDWVCFLAPCVVDTSSAESLAMFEGGKSFLKPGEQYCEFSGGVVADFALKSRQIYNKQQISSFFKVLAFAETIMWSNLRTLHGVCSSLPKLEKYYVRRCGELLMSPDDLCCELYSNLICVLLNG